MKLKLLTRLKESLMIRFTDPDLFYMRKLLELDEKGKRNSLRAKALKKKLIKLHHNPEMFNDEVIYVDIDEDDEFFGDEFKPKPKPKLDSDSIKLLEAIFGPRKPSNN